MKKVIRMLPAALILLFVIVNIVRFFAPDIKTEMVQHGEMELAYSFEALIIRNESVITADYKGVLESMVSENEMVRKSKHVASIYEDAVDESVKKKLISINERIAQIQNISSDSASYSSGYRAETEINKKISELRKAAQDKDVSALVSIKNEIRLLNDRKNVSSGDEGRISEILASLQEEKAKYESSLSKSRQDLYSPASGNYSTKIDGYERLVTPDTASQLTPEEFENLREMKITKESIKESGVVCKITDSFEWSAAVIATEEELAKLKTGDTVYLRSHSSADDVPAVISYISAPQNGRYVLCATTDVSCGWAQSERFLDIDIVKKKYSGLKVPSGAIRVVNDETGVYTVSDGIVKFKKVKILYKEGKYAMVEENNASGGGLLLYDEVIVSDAKNIRAGMRIK